MRVRDDSSIDERLSHWIASQGFWFQLRHSTARTATAKLVGRLLHVLAGLAVLVLLAAALVAAYLYKRVDMKVFRDRLPVAAAAALGVDSADVEGFRRHGGRAYIHRLEAKGGPDAFFYRLDARGVRYRMGLLDGLVGEWDAGPVTVNAAVVEVKAGAEDEKEAAAARAALFGEHDWFTFPLVEVLDATVSWGYSERTRGEIRGSRLIARRAGSGWLLEFQGGRFSQNWLRRMDIDEMVVRVEPGVLTIERAAFRRDDGRATLAGTVQGGVAPAVAWEMDFERLPVGAILPAEARPFVEGTVSGKAKVSGSTNTQEGLHFACDILLGPEDQVSLRDRLPLLRALTVVDVYNSYRRLDFKTGGFRMATGGGRLDIDQLELAAGELVRLSGRMTARPPTAEEVARALAEGPGARDSAFLESIVDEMDRPSDDEAAAEAKEDEFSLREAAQAARDADKGEENAVPSVGVPNLAMMPMTLEQAARDRYAKMLRFEGGMVMQIPGDAFERARMLRESHPADPSTGKISLEIPLAGTLFELTLDQAEELYVKGRRDQ